MDMLSQVGRPVVVVPRSQWDPAAPSPAPPPAAASAASEPVKTVVFAYNTGEPPCATDDECVQAMRRMRQAHVDKGLPDILYNFCVGGDANVYEGRGWDPVHPNSIHYSEGYQKPLVFGVIGDGQHAIATPSWTAPYEVVAPALKLVKTGVKEGRVIEDYDVTEDLDDVGSRLMRGSDRKVQEQ